MDRRKLDARLEAWAAEYGGGRYEEIGYPSRNILKTLIEHEGFVPSARGYIPTPIYTAADEIEAAVRGMDEIGYGRQAHVLRCEYFMPDAHMELRLTNLAQVGVKISRAGYYDYLAIAKAYIAGQLNRAAAA
ncbi:MULTISPECIES: hypothetical protein [unclassified Lysobacter]|uniref:hypothetical protein n=1 Tax=unclassified Lysobacter TaxID=2635362 RepID=UPI0006FABE86|nr:MULTISPECIES: hypothetical protein [unclassified Lysobacter]KRC35099.1 hypothetical protein ASE10_10540 [Lysobacter sp. Root76]KRD70787.1 hypothetical protein ASE45_02705 [Lysobacter sp. Root96]